MAMTKEEFYALMRKFEEGEVERRTLDHMKETWMAKGTGDTAHVVTGMLQL